MKTIWISGRNTAIESFMYEEAPVDTTWKDLYKQGYRARKAKLIIEIE